MTNVVDLAVHQDRPLPANEAAIWISPTMRLLRAVELVFDVTADHIRGRNRSDRFRASRAAAVWAGRRLDLSFGQLARALRRDKATVLGAGRTADRRRAVDPHFARCCDDVLRRARQAEP